MADSLTPEKRSWLMSRIKCRDTKPELVVRSAVHNMGFRFRLHRSDLPGKPDLVLPRHNKVIFVHGCFWHQHKGCRISHKPSSNTSYWNKKLARNVERDKKHQILLRKLCWRVLTIWECETKKPNKLLNKLAKFISKS